MFCAKCGKELKEEAAFCTNCGAPVRKPAEPAKPVETVKPVEPAKAAEAAKAVESAKAVEPVKPAEPAKAVEPIKAAEPAKPAEPAKAVEPAGAAEPVKPVEPAKPAPTAKEPKGQKKKKKKGGLIAAIILIVLLAGAGTGGALYFTSDFYNSRKNLKQANADYEAGEYEDALEAYETALSYDDSLLEAYTRSAEIFLGDGKYQDAIDLLQKGLKTDQDDASKSALTEKLTEAYLAGIDSEIAAGDFARAKKLAIKGEKACGDSGFGQKYVEIYAAEADSFVAAGDYESALNALDEGTEETGDGTLSAKKEEVYLAEASHALETSDCVLAAEILSQGISATGSAKLGETLNNLIDNTVLITASIYMNGQLYTESQYDGNGNEVQCISYYDNGEVYSRVENEYDAAGRKTASRTYYDSGSAALQETMQYDAAGNMIRYTEYDERGQIIYFQEMSYDDKGHVTSSKSGDPWQIYEWWTAFYNDRGDLIAKYSFGRDENDVISSEVYEYEYDDAGNKTHRIMNRYQLSDLWEAASEVWYDAAGNEIQGSDTDAYSTTDWSRQYDAGGNLTEYSYRSVEQYGYWSESAGRTVYEYDDAGNKIRETVYDENDNQVSQTVYEYDVFGNPVSTSNGSYQNTIVYQYSFTGQLQP